MKLLLSGILVFSSLSSFAASGESDVVLTGTVEERFLIYKTIEFMPVREVTVSQTVQVLKLENGDEVSLCRMFPTVNGPVVQCEVDSDARLLNERKIQVRGELVNTRGELPKELQTKLVIQSYDLSESVSILDDQTRLTGTVEREKNGIFRRSSYHIEGVSLAKGLFHNLRSLNGKKCLLTGDLDDNVLSVNKADCE